MPKKNIQSRTKNEYYGWEKEPETPIDVDDYLPTDKIEMSETATISKDSYGQFFVRFPRKISEALDLQSGFKIEFNLTKPLKPKGGARVNSISCNIIRKIKSGGKKHANKKENQAQS